MVISAPTQFIDVGPPPDIGKAVGPPPSLPVTDVTDFVTSHLFILHHRSYKLLKHTALGFGHADPADSA